MSSSTIRQQVWRTLKRCGESQSQNQHPRTPFPHSLSLRFSQSCDGLTSVISTTGARRAMSLIENISPFRTTSATSAGTRSTPSSGMRSGNILRTTKAVIGERVVPTGKTGTRHSVSSHLGIQHSAQTSSSHTPRSRRRNH